MVKPLGRWALALASLVCLPSVLPAQARERAHRWELPGFDISPRGGWRVKAHRVAGDRARSLRNRDFDRLRGPMAAGVQQSTMVDGVFRVPVILMHYSDTPAPDLRDTSQYSQVLFGTSPPLGRPYTLRTYYEQMSSGSFSMQGQVIGWMALSGTALMYEGDPGTSGCSGNPTGVFCNGLFSVDARARMQGGLREALILADVSVDFSQFDNDGPDEQPNTDDDDGYVDMMGFAHATQDGACGGNNHLWAHRWVMGGGDGGGDYVTNDAGVNGSIKIRDYFLQSALGGGATPNDACDASQIMGIGTAAHEFGHALGLPDLYDTNGPTEGVGRWSLMGSGNYSSAHSPARMDVWALNELGWVTLNPISSAGTYNLAATPIGDQAYVVDFPGSNPRNEYYLIENRQAVQADTALMRNACQVWYQDPNQTGCAGGLLIWHVDGSKVASDRTGDGSWFNTLNSGPIHGLALEEADGARDLWCPGAVPLDCNRGDAADPYPGQLNQTALSFSTNPASTRNVDGAFAGVLVDQIQQVVPGGEMSLRVRYGALTLVRAADTTAIVRVDGDPFNVYRNLLETTVTISMDAVQTSTDGRRRFTWLSWSDGGAISHDITGSLAGDTIVANLDRELRILATATAGGSITSNPVLSNLATGVFVADSTPVTLTAVPAAGSVFARWTGDTNAVSVNLQLPMHRPYTVTARFTAAPTTQQATDQLLNGTGTLTSDQIAYLDGIGNKNGYYDVGDFLAWMDLTGQSAAAAAALLDARKERP